MNVERLPLLVAPFVIMLKKLLGDFPPDSRYLVGVSGGRDSVALLDQLVRLGYQKLIVCHLNHRLRGRASEADARFVQKLAARHDLLAEIASVDVRRLARTRKLSLETAAREARYGFFARVARRRRCRTIFLGHHADDLVETFLMNLFRGAGTTGLAGMREISARRIDRVELTVVRPLLQVWRRDVEQWVKRRGLKFREDASNKDLAPLRNRVRRQIIPYLERIVGRDVRQNIWRTARIAAEEENFFETLLPAKLSKLTTLAVEPLRSMNVAVQRRMVHRWLRAGDVSNVGFDLVERVRGLLDVMGGVAKTNLPGDRHARRRAGKIFIE